MSTQRRENRSIPATGWVPSGHRRGPRYRWRRTTCTDRASALGHASPASAAPQFHAVAAVGTAPPAPPACFRPSGKKLSPGSPRTGLRPWGGKPGSPRTVLRPWGGRPGASEWLATNSLQSDYRTTQFVRPVRSVSIVSRDFRESWPAQSPPAARPSANRRLKRLSLPHIPSSSGLPFLRSALPRIPAALSCGTERYDGKGNLHLLHAA
jgi:hypothetical protein